MHITRIFLGVVAVALMGCAGEGGSSSGGLPSVEPGEKLAEPLPEGLYEAVLAQGVPQAATESAFAHYEAHRRHIKNSSHVSIIDFTKHSSKPRLFVVNVETANVDAIHVAHASGSDPDNDGYAEYFSNVPNSRRSSLGSYLISERYVGKYGPSMRTDGLDNTNSMVRPRAIVMHPSDYVKAGREKQGLSWGCPAVPYAWISKLIDRLRDGSFMYIYGVNQAKSMDLAWEDDEISRIMLDPTYVWVNESEDAPIDGE